MRFMLSQLKVRFANQATCGLLLLILAIVFIISFNQSLMTLIGGKYGYK